MPDAVRETLRLVRHRFRAARVVMIGPEPGPDPVTALQREVDVILQRAAVAHRAPCISMLQEDWIPATTADRVIDPATHHPTVAGQRYLGQRLATALTPCSRARAG